MLETFSQTLATHRHPPIRFQRSLFAFVHCSPVTGRVAGYLRHFVLLGPLSSLFCFPAFYYNWKTGVFSHFVDWVAESSTSW